MNQRKPIFFVDLKKNLSPSNSYFKGNPRQIRGDDNVMESNGNAIEVHLERGRDGDKLHAGGHRCEHPNSNENPRQNIRDDRNELWCKWQKRRKRQQSTRRPSLRDSKSWITFEASSPTTPTSSTPSKVSPTTSNTAPRQAIILTNYNSEVLYTRARANTHTHIYIYIYKYIIRTIYYRQDSQIAINILHITYDIRYLI